MKILLLGSGGREHTIAWKVAQSPLCSKLYIAPGNAGTYACGENIKLDVNDFEKIKALVLDKNIEFVIVGPEDPLVNGITDFFEADAILCKIPVLGPTRVGAMLEGSKDFAKEFMIKNHIPTASYRTFTANEKEAATNYLKKHSLPIVMKADGLAAGKGVVICTSAEEAINFLEEVWQAKKFGESGNKVVVEQFLTGIELSVFILTDGKNYILLPEAKDYKRIGEGDTGLNTGGMGTVSPVPFADAAFMQKVVRQIINPTIAGLENDRIKYRGFIFFGLINVDGNPFVIEYNVRMGDPETEVVLPRIKSDLLPFLYEAAKGELKPGIFEIEEEYAVCVIAVSGGYPEQYEKGKEIQGLDNMEDSLVFHAGTTEKDGKIVSSGGRVLAVVSRGKTISEAADKSYRSLENIQFEKMNYRRDIGKDLE